MKYRIIAGLLLLLFHFKLNAQNELRKNYSCEHKKIVEVLKDIEILYDVKFNYAPDIIAKINITLPDASRTLDEMLLDISMLSQIQFNKLNQKYIYITPSAIQNLQKVLVQAYLTKGLQKNSNGGFAYNVNNFGLLPGLTENDILESIQLLPGIANIDESATNFYVRGGLPDQNRIIWDGINIYHNGHLFGLISPFNPNAIKKVTFYYKGTPVEYSDRASSVIQMDTYENIPDKIHGNLGINGISAGAVVNMPVVKNKLSFQISYRRSYEDLLETPVFTKYEQKAFQNANLSNDRFYFKDYHFKLNFTPSTNHKLFFSTIHIDNDLENTFEQGSQRTTDIIDTENTGYSAKWIWQLNKKFRWTQLISKSYYNLFYRNIITDNSTDLQNLVKTNRIDDFFFSSVLNRRHNMSLQSALGIQISSKHITYKLEEHKSLQLILDQNNTIGNTYSVFYNFRYQSDKNDIYAGARLNYYQNLHKIKLEPRFVYNRYLNRKWYLQITGEVKNQSILQLRSSIYNSFTLEDKIWQMSQQDKIPLVSAYHLTAGSIFKHKTWLVDFDTYYKYIDGISAYLLGLFNPSDARLHKGNQKTTGIDIFVKKNFKNLKTGLKYTYSQSISQFDDFNEGKTFTASSDIRHSFYTSLLYKYKHLNLALGWQFRLGKPIPEIEDEDENEIYYLEEINEYRLPRYNRLDFSASYYFYLSKAKDAKVNFSFSIRNLLNNKIVINKDFVGNNSINDPVRIQNYYSLGFTPNLMIRFNW